MSVYIIAEAGVNHNGNIHTALQMIDAAKACGCDCVKFQTFKTEALVTKTAKKAAYQVENTRNQDSQYNMLKNLELSYDDFAILKEHCDKVEIDFMSTPFDRESVDVLERLGVQAYKLSSGDITNKPLLEYVADKHKPVILSTGMCTMEEVKDAVEWIEAKKNHQITLLHCTSNYPTPYDEVNMKAMLTLKDSFPYAIGYSDHTKGIIMPIMSVAMGATVLEKHFTLDKQMDGPDHKASLDVQELEDMVAAVRNVEAAKGDGIKQPTASEMSTREVARKSVVVNKTLKKGIILSDEDLSVKRPGTGIAPKYIQEFTGKVLLRDIEEDTLINWDDVRQVEK